MALSCFALQVPHVRVATQVPGSMVERDSAQSAENFFTVIFPSRRALRKIAKNPTCSTWDDFTCPIPRVVRGTILRQQLLHVQYVGRFYVRPNYVKSPSVSWDSISYGAGFYVD